MANIEGILFADLFINSKDLFVNLFTNYYSQNKQQIDPVTQRLEQVLTAYQTKAITPAMANDFKKSWNDFEKIVLLNQGDLELLVAYRGASGKNGQFSQIIKQEDVEGTGGGPGASYGINAGHDLIKDSIKALNASQVEQFLQFHLNGLLNQLESKINKTEAHKIHLYHQACLTAAQAGATKIHLTGMLYRDAFYGGTAGYYFGGQGLGKAYDAFMNHMANKETNIFNYLKSSGQNDAGSISLMTHRETTVFTEEGGVEQMGHFPQLLKDSTNHTGWYTGGDIIIINPDTMAVVYNIQLKTTTANKPSVFGERVEKIRKFIQGFDKLSPQQKAERIFDFMLTSISNHDAFNQLPQQDVEDVIKNNIDKVFKDMKFTISI